MFKIIFTCLAALIMLAACAAEEQTLPSEPPESSSPQSSSTAESSSLQSSSTVESTPQPSASPDTAQPKEIWPQLFSAYSSRSKACYALIREAFETHDDQSSLYALCSFRFTVGDITLAYSKPFFASKDTTIEGAFKILGFNDCDYTEDGSTAIASMKNSAGQNYCIELSCDASTAQLIASLDGETSEFISIYVCDEYICKAYWGANTHIELLMYDSGDFLLSWTDSTSDMGTSLYQNAAYGSSPDFAHSGSGFAMMKDGELSGQS